LIKQAAEQFLVTRKDVLYTHDEKRVARKEDETNGVQQMRQMAQCYNKLKRNVSARLGYF
jgi:hypothetical protein